MCVFVCERIRSLIWVRSSSGRVPPLSLWSLRRGAAASAFLCLRCLGFVMSSLVALLSSRVARGLAAAPRSVADRVPGSSWSACVEIVAVVRAADRVSVVCSDGRVRVCRVEYAARALDRSVSVAAVADRLATRIGQPVRFLAAFGYSADMWFVACFADDAVL